MKRVILIVLDSVGIGALPDATQYGDAGANTLAHLHQARPLHVPALCQIGLGHIPASGMQPCPAAIGAYGKMREVSPGKDTTTGHWELAGVRLAQPFPTFPDGFPAGLIQAFEEKIGTRTLGNFAASGTAIIEQLGEEHMRTGYPIVYTSADSVFQIAAHEEVVPINTLYAWCEIARGLLQGPLGVGRVIARPFVGTGKGYFQRTGRRRDFSLPPTGQTLLDVLHGRGLAVLGVGKIEDIFAHRGLTGSNHASGNAACIEATMQYMAHDFSGLLFVNLVDFDMVHGHRRDVQGYAAALEAFDKALVDIQKAMGEGDLLLISADHGCDPTFRGTDHTREYVPLLAWHRRLRSLVDLGVRSTFSDVAATIAQYFDCDERFGATSFLDALFLQREAKQ